MPTWGHNGKDGVYEVHGVHGSSAVPRVSLAYSYMYRDWDFKRKYWRAHCQTERPTNVMALLSCFSMPNNYKRVTK